MATSPSTKNASWGNNNNTTTTTSPYYETRYTRLQRELKRIENEEENRGRLFDEQVESSISQSFVSPKKNRRRRHSYADIKTSLDQVNPRTPRRSSESRRGLERDIARATKKRTSLLPRFFLLR